MQTALNLRNRSAVLTSTAFAKCDLRRRWLVKGLLVADQPIVIGGGIKTLKTSLTLDLAISLGSGTPFLQSFSVPKAVTVVYMSGENCHGFVQEAAERISRTKGCRLAATKTKWSFRLPDLGSDVGLQRLSQTLGDAGAKVVILDPMYACLSSGATKSAVGNLFDVGALLKDAASACLEAGATPIMVHPTSKQTERFDRIKPGEVAPLELRDLAFAGMAEYARQWLLLNRRSSYRFGSGRHELLMSGGGSAGQSGCWEVDIDEGVLKIDFTGRRWDISVSPYGDSCPASSFLLNVKQRSQATKGSELTSSSCVGRKPFVRSRTTS